MSELALTRKWAGPSFFARFSGATTPKYCFGGAITSVLFTDTTTIGVRYQEVLRDRLDRRTVTVETPAGAIRFKIASRNGRTLNASPEFEDCARAASERGMSIKDVQALATKAWLDSRPS